MAERARLPRRAQVHQPAARLLAGLLFPVVLLVAACGSSEEKKPLGEWVNGLCSAAADFQRLSDAAGDRFAASDLSTVRSGKEAFATALADQAAARTAFRKAFDDLGQPDIDGGKEVVAAFRKRFDENDKRADEIKARVEAIPERADFVTEFAQIAEELAAQPFLPELEAVAARHSAVNDLIAAIEEDSDCARTIFVIDPADNPESEAWVAGICTALNTWITSLSRAADDLEVATNSAVTVADVERALIDFFEQGLADTRTLDRALERLSPPPVRDGEAIHRVFLDAGEDLVAAMERLTREARAADFSTIEQAEAESIRFQGLIEQLFGDVAASFDELQRYDPEGLDVLFQELPECQF